MIDTHSNITSADIGTKDLVPGLRAFLKEHGVALENAADFCGDVADNALPPRVCQREVWAFLALVRACIEHDPERGASSRCLRLDPTEPRAQDIQQLHDCFAGPRRSAV